MNAQVKEVAYTPVSTVARKTLRSPLDTAVVSLCERIRLNPAHPLTLVDMERLSGFSRRSLENEFHRQFGCSPVKWQQTERLSQAREYLTAETGKVVISEVAHEFGFASASKFIAYYKRFFGETPKDTAIRMRYIRKKRCSSVQQNLNIKEVLAAE